VKIGVMFFPIRPKFFLPLAQKMDELRYDAVWLGDHLIFPTRIESAYPYGRDLGAPLPSTPLFDPLISLAFVAAQTTHVQIGTSIYIMTLRHPLVAAKQAATLDTLAGGRLLFGIGSGWLREEVEAIDLPWDKRGTRLEEAVGIMRRLWSEKLVAHEGQFYAFPETGFEPKPPRGKIPLILGGETPIAIDRAARIGDGWTGVDHTPESASERVRQLREVRGDRPPMDISVGLVTLPDLDTVRRFHDAGVDRLILRGSLFAAADKQIATSLGNLERFAETVMYPAAGS
jgi:probable F420-dependent oxidoreductase